MRGAFMAGECVVGGVHGRASVPKVCMTGGIDGRGVCGGGHVWYGVCGRGTYVAGETASAAAVRILLECILASHKTSSALQAFMAHK